MQQICTYAAAVHHGDPTGWVYTIFAIAIAASEVAIGLLYSWPWRKPDDIIGRWTF